MNRHASMNRIFRLIWNESLSAFVPAAETARGKGKSAKRKLIATALVLSAGTAQAGPTGGQVTTGSGAITQSGSTTTIRQSSQNLGLDWQTFDIAPHETVNFVQPSSTAIAVNRILAAGGSVILGHLDANGQVYLINPDGVIFGKGAEVNVGGLIASTLDFDPRTLAGPTKAFAGSGTGTVSNEGSITAPGGSVALLGNHVSNSGLISAQLGSVALGAGSAATLTFSGVRLVGMQVDQSVLNSVAANGGLIRADGGMVLMNAGAQNSLLASVVNNTGVIEARTLDHRDGAIVLLGGMRAGTVNVGGTLDASAPAGGDGGAIETSGAHVEIANTAKVTSAAAQGFNGSWLIDPTDFTIAAAGGDTTGAQLSGALGLGNVVIQSSSGATGTAGDINVNDTVTWVANTLTLSAQDNINLNSAMNGSGTATLALRYGQGAVAAGNSSTYFVNAPVNLPSGAHFSTKLGSNGATIPFTVVTGLGVAGDATTAPATATLQGIAATSNLSGNFVLGGNIDASPTSAWNAGAGFTPIGTAAQPFVGVFDGLGHTLGGLSINLPSATNVGLFGVSSTEVQNVGLLGGSVTGAAATGSLVGENIGAVFNSYATGTVTGTGNTSSPQYIGGLVGSNAGAIADSHATGAVTGTGEGSVGGLLGSNLIGGSVSNAYATGAVSATLNYVGGLTGANEGSLSNSYATGSVNGASYVGGLVGVSQDAISGSHATGNVTGSGVNVGGLLGFLNNAAQTPAPVSNSYATGAVSGVANVGGLVGDNQGGTISNSYASGSINGTLEVGGIVGYNDRGFLSNAFYNVDQVTINGLHLLTAGGIYGAQYVDWSAHNESLVIGNYSATLPAGSGGYYNVSSVQGLQDSLGFSESNAAYNFRLTAGVSLPPGFSLPYFAGSFDGNGKTLSNLSLDFPNSNLGLFGYLPSAATVIANVGVAQGSVSGVDYVGGLVGNNKAGASISNSYFSGTVSGNTAVGGLVGWNSGSITNSYVSGSVSGASYSGGLTGLNYGTVTNSYASGSVAGSSYVGGLIGNNYGTVSHSFYNSSFNPGLTGIGGGSGGLTDVPGTVGGLTAAQLQGRANFTSPTGANGGIDPGWDFANTWVLYEGHTDPLLRAFMTPLTVGGNAGRTYDGTAFAPGTGDLSYSVAPDPSHLFGAPTVAGTATGAVHAGAYTFTPGGLYSDQQGYLLSYAPGTLTIHPAPLNVTGTTAAKVYDGTTVATVTGGSLTGLVAGDSISLVESGTYGSPHAGTAIPVSVTASIGGANVGDYILTQPSGLTGTITPAPLTISGTTVGNKVYDGTTAASLSGGTLSGLVSGDSVTLIQAGNFVSSAVGSGIGVTAADRLSGPSASDYSITQPIGLTGMIVPAPMIGPAVSFEAEFAAAFNTKAQVVSDFAAIDQQTIEVAASVTLAGRGTLTIIDGGMRLPSNGVDGNE